MVFESEFGISFEAGTLAFFIDVFERGVGGVNFVVVELNSDFIRDAGFELLARWREFVTSFGHSRDAEILICIDGCWGLSACDGGGGEAEERESAE